MPLDFSDLEEKKDLDFSDLGKPQSAIYTPAAERGFFGDIASHAGRGIMQAAELTGRGLEAVGAEKAGGLLRDYAQEKRAESKFLRPDVSEVKGEDGWFYSKFMQGVESIGPSAIPLVTGTVAGVATGNPAIGWAAGAGMLGLEFGAGTYKQKLQEYLDKGVPEDQARNLARKYALVEAGGEAASDILFAITGGAAKALSGGLKIGSETAKHGIKALLSKTPKQVAFDMAKLYGGELATETWQQRQQAGLDAQTGLVQDQGYLESLAEVAVPTAVMTLAFGLGAHGLDAAQKNAMINQLNSENKKDRIEAVKAIADRISDDEIKRAWIGFSAERIGKDQPININQDFIVEYSPESLDEEGDELLSRTDEYGFSNMDDTLAGIQKKVEAQAKKAEREAVAEAGYRLATPEPQQPDLATIDQVIFDETVDRQELLGREESPATVPVPESREVDQAIEEIRFQEYEPEIPKTPESVERSKFPATEYVEKEKRGEVDYTPAKYEMILGQMVKDLDAGEIGHRFIKEDGTWDGVKSTNPDWFKNNHVLKKAGKVGVKRVLEKVRKNQELTPNQFEVWLELQRAADKEMKTNPEYVAGVEAERIEKEEGITIEGPETITAGNLSPGDKIVVLDRDGVPDVIEAKSFDSKGNLILEDGAILVVDPFEQINIIGKKIKGDGSIPEEVGSLLLEAATSSNKKQLEKTRSEIAASKDNLMAPYKNMIIGAIDRRIAELSDNELRRDRGSLVGSTGPVTAKAGSAIDTIIRNRAPGFEAMRPPAGISGAVDTIVRHRAPAFDKRMAGISSKEIENVRIQAETQGVTGGGNASQIVFARKSGKPFTTQRSLMIQVRKRRPDLAEKVGSEYEAVQVEGGYVLARKEVAANDREEKGRLARREQERKGTIPEQKTGGKGRPLNSKTQGTINYVSDIKQELGELAGNVKIVDKNEAKEILGKDYDDSVAGFYKDGEAYLVQGNVKKGEAKRKLAHELGVHANKLGIKDTETFDRIIRSVIRKSQGKGKDAEAIRAAMEMVPSDTNPKHMAEEVLAYLVEQGRTDIGVVRRFIAYVKRFLVEKLGVDADILNNLDLQALAYGAIKGKASGKTSKPIEEQVDLNDSFVRENRSTDQNEQSNTSDIKFSKRRENAFRAAQNTENLNAEKDGEKSGSSVEFGREKLEEISRKTEAVGEKRAAARKEWVDDIHEKFIKAVSVINDPVKSIAEKQKAASALARALPEKPRSRMLTALSLVSRVKSEKKQAERLLSFLDKAELELTKYYRRQLIKGIRKLTKRRKRPKDRIRTGHGARYEKLMSYIRTAVKMKPEEAELKASELANREFTADLHNQIEAIKKFGGLSEKTFDELVELKHELRLLKDTARLTWGEREAAFRDAVADDIDMVAREIVGGEPPTINAAMIEARKQKERTVKGKLMEMLSAAENSIQSWELLLDKITAGSGKGILKSDTVKTFGSVVHAATRDYERFSMEETDTINQAAKKIFGVDSNRTLKKIFAEKSKKIEGKVFLGDESIPLSPFEAGYWYQVWRSDQPSARKTFEKMGVTEETIEQIKDLAGDDVIRWGEWLMDEYYDSVYDKVNAVYSKINGIDLPKVGKYVPFHRDYMGEAEDMAPEHFFSGIEHGSMKKGALKERVNTTLAFRVMDMNSVLIQHVSEMNHYRAWALPTKYLDAVFGSRYIRKLVRLKHGISTAKTLDSFLDDFRKSPNEQIDRMKFLDRVRARITSSLIGLNLVVFVKQLTSIPAYAADIPMKEWIKWTSLSAMNPVKAAREVGFIMGRSTMLKARYKKGFERDIADAQKMAASDIVAGSKSLTDKLMAPTKVGDFLAIVSGGLAVYKYHYHKALDAGKTQEEAERIAITEFEKATERSQQASNTKDLGWFQRGGPVLKLFTMFMTTPASYSRMMWNAIRHIKDDRVTAARTLFVYGIVLPAMFKAVSDGFAYDDEDEALREMRSAIFLAPFAGIPILRTMTEGVANAVGGKYYRENFTPITQLYSTGKQVITDTYKGIAGGTARKLPEEYFMRAAANAAKMAGYTTGVPVRQMMRFAGAVEDIDNTDYPLRRLVGWSRKTLEEN